MNSSGSLISTQCVAVNLLVPKRLLCFSRSIETARKRRDKDLTGTRRPTKPTRNGAKSHKALSLDVDENHYLTLKLQYTSIRRDGRENRSVLKSINKNKEIITVAKYKVCTRNTKENSMHDLTVRDHSSDWLQ